MLFQRVGVQFRLLFSDIRILACPFGFDDRQRRAVPFEETHELAAPDDIFELLADKEQAMRIHASLHRLKEPYREVFTLRVLGELHFRDIADLFGKSESWAKVTFYRAKDKLIEDMEEHHEH